MPRTAARPRRSARAADTRRRLLHAGRRAFARKGLAATNLREDVLAPARVSVGSFYHQFRDKTDLLLAVLREHSEAFRAALREAHTPAPGRTVADMARDSYELAFRLVEAGADLWRIRLRESLSAEPRVRAFLREDRARWIDSLAADYRRVQQAAGAPAFDAELAAELIAGLATTAAARLVELPEARRAAERDRLRDGLVAFTLGGITALADASHPHPAPAPERSP